MSGIYIHIPFCVKKCSYCNFFSSTNLSQKDSYLQALCKEMELRADYLDEKPVRTLYFGGGTPSILTPQELESLIAHARKVFGFHSDVEITLEANPNNLNEEYFKQLANTAINRLSIGIQSFFDENLQILGRIHTAKHAENCVELADKYNFSNLSIDLMYGYPQLTTEQWQANLQKVKEIPHLSCYSLSLESNSVLYKQVQNASLQLPDEEQIIEQYSLLSHFAKDNQFIHYETSNFCKVGCFSKHNTAYWQDKAYIGLGCAAHSFNRKSRQWNLSDIDNYIQQIASIPTADDWAQKAENMLFEQEELTQSMRVNEYVMTSLRTIWGCDLQYVETHFSKHYRIELEQKLTSISPTYYFVKDEKIMLTEEGSLFADAIASNLFGF